MTHDIEVYIVESFEDVLELVEEDVYDFMINGDECISCGMMVGVITEEESVIPCVVAMAAGLAEVPWTVCLECAAPVIYPSEFGILRNIE